MKQLSFGFYESPTGRICTECGEWKSFKEFSRHPNGLYGRNSKCKSCINAYAKEHHKENRNARNAYSREWHKKNPEKVRAYRNANRENIDEYNKAYQPQYRIRNRERRRAYSRQYYVEHREERLAYHRQWATENRNKAKVNQINYRTRKKDNEGSFAAQEWEDLCEKYDNKCLCCGATDKPLTVDHIVPVSKGGSSNIENLQCLCKSCNCRKSDKIIDYRPHEDTAQLSQTPSLSQ